VFFSLTKPAPAINQYYFSHSKSAPATGHSQPNREYSLWYIYCIAISCKQTTPVIKKTKKMTKLYDDDALLQSLSAPHCTELRNAAVAQRMERVWGKE